MPQTMFCINPRLDDPNFQNLAKKSDFLNICKKFLLDNFVITNQVSAKLLIYVVRFSDKIFSSN